MFFVLSKIFDLAFAPLSWALLAVTVAGVAVWRKRPRLAMAALVGALVLLYAFSIEPVSNALQRSLERPPRTTMRAGVTYDAVVVMGGLVDVYATEPGGPPSLDDNIERLLSAWDVWRSGRARAIVVSGGAPDPDVVPVVEARVLADQLAAWGVPRDKILVDDTAVNTRDNATHVSTLARPRGWKDVLVVTSAAHMARAKGCFEAVGLSVDTLAVDFRAYDRRFYTGSVLPRASALAMSTGALREYAGRFVYRVLGYSK
jgi:uncharacterized SAM-binding protein YcdF (DUF218 family)